MAATASISELHPDVVRTHILTRLDGPALVSASCASSELNSLASEEALWSSICRSTWPSTDSPRVKQVISSLPRGPRSFFSSSFPLLSSPSPPRTVNLPGGELTELISAVDVYYKGELVFTKVVETETVSAWFRCSPFRIDMLDPKDTCRTPIPHPDTDNRCRELAGDLTLSWILIDPAGRRVVNLSGHGPVSVQRHWLSGEIHARFGSVVGGSRGVVQCGILVTCGGRGGAMHVREVSLQVEDLDGMFLNGRDSLVILQGAFGGKKGIKGREEREVGRRWHEEFLEMKRKRKERQLKKEGALDMLCVAFGVLLFASAGLFLLFR